MYETTGTLPPNSERLGPAFAEFYSGTHDYVMWYANLLTDPSQAEEAVSIAVTNTWQGVANGRVEFSESPDEKRRNAVRKYLITAVQHSVAGDARKANTHEKYASELEANTLTTSPPAEQEALVYADEMAVYIGAVLKKPIDREILLLAARGLSTTEAAAALGMAEGSYRSRLCRARRKLIDDPAFGQLAAEYGYSARRQK